MDWNKKKLIKASVAAAAVLILAFLGWFWFSWRVYVEPGETLMITKKFGDPNPNPDQFQVIPEAEKYEDVKGIRPEFFGEGFHFFNPVLYETEIYRYEGITGEERKRKEQVTKKRKIKQKIQQRGTYRFDREKRTAKGYVDISPLELGVVISKTGSSTPESSQNSSDENKYLIDYDFGSEKLPEKKGIIKQVLTPGRWRLHPEAFEVKVFPAQVIPAGYVGVIESLAGKENKNSDLAKWGEQGIMKTVLQPGIYYLNPRQYRVYAYEIGHRQISIKEMEIKTKTKWIKADISLVYEIQPQNAPRVLDNIGPLGKVEKEVLKEELRNKPFVYAENFTAGELVSGEGRQEFIDKFSSGLEESLKQNYVDVLVAVVRNIEIPDPVREPKQEENKQKELQKLEKELRRTIQVKSRVEERKKEMERKVAVRGEEVNKEVELILKEGTVNVDVIEAEKEKEVARIEKNERKIMADRTRVLEGSKADAEKMVNEAKGERLQELVNAVGDSKSFVLYQFAAGLREDLDVNIRYAGPGTLWTDMGTRDLQKISAAEILRKIRDEADNRSRERNKESSKSDSTNTGR